MTASPDHPQGLSRRGFLRAALGASSLVLLAACAPAAPSAAPTQPAKPASGASGAPAAATPGAAPPTTAPASSAAGTAAGSRQLVMSSTTEPFSMNPYSSAVSQTIYYGQFVFDGLTRPDDQLRPMPSLAESWTIDPDGLGYTFTIRRGVKFHDGSDLTAADVKKSWELIAHPDNKTGAQLYGFFSRVAGAEAYNKGEAQDIAGVTIPDDFTVRVKMASVYGPFLALSAFQPILPRSVYGNIPPADFDKHPTARQPIGTGPFKWVEWKNQDFVALEAHKDYWGGAPKLDRIVIKTVPDPTTIPSLLRSNTIQLAGIYAGISATDYEEFSRDSTFTLSEYPGTNWYIEFRCDDPLFSDVNVRRALIHAVDREAIVKDVLLGHGLVNDSPIIPASWAYVQPRTRYEYNPDKAKQLLAGAGWTAGPNGALTKNGEPFSFELTTFMAPSTYPEIVQQMWKQVGVDATINRMDFGAFWGPQYLARRLRVAGLHVLTGIYTDPEYPLGGYFFSRLNRNGYNNPKADELYLATQSSLDEATRKQRYAEYVEQLSQDAPHMWVASPNEIWARSSKLKLPDTKLGFLLLTNVKDWELTA
jgi:peptide/nickel transport system substrate-binding protein